MIDYLRFVFRMPEVSGCSDYHATVSQKIRQGLNVIQAIAPGIELNLDDPSFSKGHHGFTHSAQLEVQTQTVGIVAAGGNNGVIMVDLSGGGCRYVLDWEKTSGILGSIGARLSRVDVAYDDYDGVYTVHDVRQAFLEGAFDNRGRTPSQDQAGSWDNKKEWFKGLTYYIGKLKNGKSLVAYEKGKQLGDKDSPWLRIEGRFQRTTQKDLDYSILTKPLEHLKKAYSWLSWITTGTVECPTFLYKTKERIKFSHLLHYASQGYGKVIHFALRYLDYKPSYLVQSLEVHGLPKRLILDRADPGGIQYVS